MLAITNNKPNEFFPHDMKMRDSVQNPRLGAQIFELSPFKNFATGVYREKLEGGLDDFACFNDQEGRDFFTFLNIQEVHEAYKAFLPAKQQIADNPLDTLINSHRQLPSGEQLPNSLAVAKRYKKALEMLLLKINKAKQLFVDKKLIAFNQQSTFQKAGEWIRVKLFHTDPEPAYVAVGDWESQEFSAGPSKNEQKDFLCAVEAFERFVQTLLREAIEIVSKYEIAISIKSTRGDKTQEIIDSMNKES